MLKSNILRCFFFSFALKVKSTELNFNYIYELKFLFMALLQIHESIIKLKIRIV